MGSPITSWEGAEVYFTGAGGGSPTLFLILAVVAVVGAIWYGGVHEAHSYAKLELE